MKAECIHWKIGDNGEKVVMDTISIGSSLLVNPPNAASFMEYIGIKEEATEWKNLDDEHALLVPTFAKNDTLGQTSTIHEFPFQATKGATQHEKKLNDEVKEVLTEDFEKITVPKDEGDTSQVDNPLKVPAVAVKPEAYDVDISGHKMGSFLMDNNSHVASDTSIGLRAVKRQRMFMEAIEVPTVEEVYGKRVRYDRGERRIQELNDQIAKLENPNAHKKEGLGFNMRTVMDRLQRIRTEPYPINLDQSILNATVSREFTSHLFGGNGQSTFPSVRKEKLEEHGMDDWMYLNLYFNPNAPQIPGTPGLFFKAMGRHADKRPKVQRVMTRMGAGKWQYQGQYAITPAESLTKEEWAEQGSKVHDTWANEIIARGWGKTVRARICLRRELGRPFTTKELKEALAIKRPYNDVTPDEIRRAFMRGEEWIAVWTMKCVGYDVDFQRKLHEQFPNYVPRDTKPSKKGSKKEDGDNGLFKKAVKQPRGKRGKKRKLTETDDSQSDYDMGPEDVQDLDEADREWEKQARVVRKPRGTRSRPIKVV